MIERAFTLILNNKYIDGFLQANVKAKSCIHCCNFEVSFLRGFPHQSSMAFYQHDFLVLL